MARRTVGAAAALVLTAVATGPACGGTLEGRYRRGELPTTTSTAPRAPGTTGPTAPTTASTGGTAAGHAGPG